MAISKSILVGIVFGVALISLVVTFVELPSGTQIVLKVPSGHSKPKNGKIPRPPQVQRAKRRTGHVKGLVPLPEAPPSDDEDAMDPYLGEHRPNPPLEGTENKAHASDLLTYRMGKFRKLPNGIWAEEDLSGKPKFEYKELREDETGRVVHNAERGIFLHLPYRRGFSALGTKEEDLDKPWRQWEWMQPDIERSDCPTAVPAPTRVLMRHKLKGEELVQRKGQGTGHSFHVVYNVEPGYYMDWQSRYNFYWFLETQKDAGYTRLLSSDKEDALASIIPTFTAPAYPSTYKPFNKAYGLMHLLRTDRIKEDIVALIDSDCYLLWDMTYLAGIAKKGSPVAHQGYMGPIPYPDNPTHRNQDYYDLAAIFCKDCKFVDPIAVPIFIHKDDFVVLAPLWVKKIEEMRAHTELWKKEWRVGRFNLDWTVEMYGYIFAAAEMGLKHQMREDMELIITWDKLFIAPMIHFSLPVDNGRSHWHKGSHKDEEPEKVPHTAEALDGYSPIDQCLLTMTYEAAIKAPKLPALA